MNSGLPIKCAPVIQGFAQRYTTLALSEPVILGHLPRLVDFSGVHKRFIPFPLKGRGALAMKSNLHHVPEAYHIWNENH